MIDSLDNLTSQAVDDFAAILHRSLSWGSARASKTRRDLVRRFAAIAAVEGFGHRRADLAFRQPTLCLTIAPHVIIYNPESRIVLRIVDGRRDFRVLFEGDPASS